MDINTGNINALSTAIMASFNQSLADAPATWMNIAMEVGSTTAENFYPKLAELPGMREWLGDRQINRLEGMGFSIRNRKFENTIAISVDTISDDQYGIYSNVASEFGRTAGELPDDLVWEQLERGFTDTHYDGQNFFDTDHPVEDADGSVQSQSNFMGGTGAAWYLVDMTRSFKPIIYQNRLPAMITPKTRMDDDNVFDQDEFVWGAKARAAAGFGSWQLITASRQPLTAASYAAAKQQMLERTGHKGRKLNIRPSLLVVSAANEGAAKELLMAERNAAGATNVWRNDVQLHVENRLTL